MVDQATEVAIIGAGPAGLTAGYILGKHKIPVAIFEADPKLVGGISRTVEYNGYCFDIGGHRFFSKSKEVEELWTELLPNDFLVRPRSSRIYYRNKFFSYPLKAFDALSKLGLLESTLCVASYARAKLVPVDNPLNLEDWVTNQFGSRLFNIFFKTYTEKVWGMNCKEISADWAAQRIKGLSLGGAIIHSLGLGKKSGGDQAKTLIESFRYPRKGPGMMWDAAAARIREQGGTLDMGTRVEALAYDAGKDLWTLTVKGPEGSRTVTAKHVISSAPMREVIKHTTPSLSAEAMAAADSLRYRDFLIVALMLKDKHIFEDNWIYIHDPTVRVGRIQNFKSWSPDMIPAGKGDTVCYGMEYFCFENDGVWARTDADLIQMAKAELEKLGLARGEDVLDGCVVRQKKAYPVYDDGYAARVQTIRKEIDAKLPTLHVVGRNGMHMYNNQDHAMMTAMLTAENIIAKKKIFDVWNVNQDAAYHEAGTAGQESSVSGLRLTPSRVA